MDTITLVMHHCKSRVSFPVKFMGNDAEQKAINYIQNKTDRFARWEHEDYPVDDKFVKLLDVLYPTCGHGLSLSLCAGPGHYSDH